MTTCTMTALPSVKLTFSVFSQHVQQFQTAVDLLHNMHSSSRLSPSRRLCHSFMEACVVAKNSEAAMVLLLRNTHAFCR